MESCKAWHSGINENELMSVLLKGSENPPLPWRVWRIVQQLTFSSSSYGPESFHKETGSHIQELQYKVWQIVLDSKVGISFIMLTQRKNLKKCVLQKLFRLAEQ